MTLSGFTMFWLINFCIFDHANVFQLFFFSLKIIILSSYHVRYLNVVWKAPRWLQKRVWQGSVLTPSPPSCSDPGVSVDCHEPKREPALHHGHHAPDHPVLQRDCPAQFCALSGTCDDTGHITFPSQTGLLLVPFEFAEIACGFQCELSGAAVLCFAGDFPDHTVLSVKFQWRVLQASEVGDKPDSSVSARPLFEYYRPVCGRSYQVGVRLMLRFPLGTAFHEKGCGISDSHLILRD